MWNSTGACPCNPLVNASNATKKKGSLYAQLRHAVPYHCQKKKGTKENMMRMSRALRIVL
jgi:hypothetical protein